MSNNHDINSPSSFDRRIFCPGSRKAEEGLPDRSSSDADRGTRAHTYIDWWNKFRMDKRGIYRPPSQEEFQLNDEDMAAIRIAQDYLNSFVIFNEFHSERKVDPALLLGRDDMKGTSDITIDCGSDIHNADYKHGAGVYVHHVNNTQNILYAIGVWCEKLKQHGPDVKPPKYWHLTIIQPRYERAEPIRTWTITHEQLMSYVPMLKLYAQISDNDDAPRRPGEKQCRFCKARGVCKTLANYALKHTGSVFVDIDQDPSLNTLLDLLHKDPRNMSLEQCAAILNHEGTIKSFLSGLKQHLTMAAKVNRKVPGWKLTSGQGSRDYLYDEKNIASKLKKFGFDPNLLYESKLKSPKQMELTFKQKVTKEQYKVLQDLIYNKPGEPYLVPSSHSGRTVITDAAEIFKPIK